MAAVAELLQRATRDLETISDSAQLDAQLLLAHCLKRDRTYLFTWPEHEVDELTQAHFHQLLARRCAGEPVAYLLGYREFFGRTFMVSPATLIPRPDTELLVETALSLLPADRPLAVADLGTGTGAIAISLALERPQWSLQATDLTADILDLAERNARSLQAGNVRFLQSSWLEAIDGPLDAVIANPPYIRDDDPHLQQGDVRFEPRSALVSGPDGLEDLRIITTQSTDKLRSGGWLMVEHGYDQGSSVRQLFTASGLVEAQTRTDINGHERCTVARVP